MDSRSCSPIREISPKPRQSCEIFPGRRGYATNAMRLKVALQRNDENKVRGLLEEDEYLAIELLPGYSSFGEPPLCVAVLCKCSASILKLLLEAGSPVGMVGQKERTPLQLLALSPKRVIDATGRIDMGLRAEDRRLLVLAATLLRAGAEDEIDKEKGVRTSDLLSMSGCSRAANLVRMWPFLPVLAVLKASYRRGSKSAFNQLEEQLFEHICTYIFQLERY